MAKHFELCSDCRAEFEVLSEPEVPFAPVARPYYCADCFSKYFDVKNVPYIANFVAFLNEKLRLAKGSRIIVAKAKRFLYQVLLEEKGSKEPKFICTIELIHAGVAEPRSKFLVLFSTRTSKIQNITAFIKEFLRKYGEEAEAQVISLRKF